MSIHSIAQLKALICDEEPTKGICVLVGKDKVYEIRRVISSDEGIILACETMGEDPPVTKPSERAKLPP